MWKKTTCHILKKTPSWKNILIFVVKFYVLNSRTRKFKQDYFHHCYKFPRSLFPQVLTSFYFINIFKIQDIKREKNQAAIHLKAIHTMSAFSLAIWSSFSFTSSSLLRAATDSEASFSFSSPVFTLELINKIKSM